MQLRPTTPKPPAGFSFDLPDLLMLQAWADFHDLRMAIELDVCAEGDEYEELVGLYDRTDTLCRWTMWRSGDGFVVQPTQARVMLFDRMADVLELLIPAPDYPV